MREITAGVFRFLCLHVGHGLCNVNLTLCLNEVYRHNIVEPQLSSGFVGIGLADARMRLVIEQRKLGVLTNVEFNSGNLPVFALKFGINNNAGFAVNAQHSGLEYFLIEVLKLIIGRVIGPQNHAPVRHVLKACATCTHIADTVFKKAQLVFAAETALDGQCHPDVLFWLVQKPCHFGRKTIGDGAAFHHIKVRDERSCSAAIAGMAELFGVSPLTLSRALKVSRSQSPAERV